MQLFVHLEEKKVSPYKLPLHGLPEAHKPVTEGSLASWQMGQEAVSLRQPLSSPLLLHRNDCPFGNHLSWVLFWSSSPRELKSWYRAEIRERPSSIREEKMLPETIGWGHWRRRGYVLLGSLIENLIPRDQGFSIRRNFLPGHICNIWSNFWWSHLGKECYWKLVSRNTTKDPTMPRTAPPQRIIYPKMSGGGETLPRWRNYHGPMMSWVIWLVIW